MHTLPSGQTADAVPSKHSAIATSTRTFMVVVVGYNGESSDNTLEAATATTTRVLSHTRAHRSGGRHKKVYCTNLPTGGVLCKGWRGALVVVSGVGYDHSKLNTLRKRTQLATLVSSTCIHTIV